MKLIKNDKNNFLEEKKQKNVICVHNVQNTGEHNVAFFTVNTPH